MFLLQIAELSVVNFGPFLSLYLFESQRFLRVILKYFMVKFSLTGKYMTCEYFREMCCEVYFF